MPADQTVAGGPSVLFDAVALVASAEGVASLATDPAAKDFVISLPPKFNVAAEAEVPSVTTLLAAPSAVLRPVVPV